jgi:molybdate transport system substrate-binding protein
MTRTTTTAAVILAAACLIGTVACGSSATSGVSPTSGAAAATSSAPALTGTITVFAASSLTGTFTSLGKSFEAAHPGTTVKFSFGSSSTLAQQIIAGAPADVFASASPKNMAQVASEVDTSTNFVSNTAEIAVAPDAKAKVTSIADLGRAGVTVALCEPSVPCGALAATVLKNAGVTVTPKTQGLDVKSTLAYVTDGQVDAAVVYVTDVKAAGSKVVAVPVPAADNASTEYPIATVKDSQDAALAAAFVAYVEGATGKAVLTGAGFSAP